MDAKQVIIRKAFALFMSMSYKEVTLNKLLKGTGLSKGAFYHHFRSKDELLTLIVEQFLFEAVNDDEFSPSPSAGFIDNMESLISMKEQAFEYFANFTGAENKEINFFMFIAQAIQYLPQVREKVMIFMEKEKKTIGRILAIASGNNELKPDLDLNWLSEHIMTAFDGTEMHGVLLNRSDKTIEKERLVIRQLFELIKR